MSKLLRVAAIRASLAVTAAMDCYGKRTPHEEIDAWLHGLGIKHPIGLGNALRQRFKYRSDGWLDAALPVRKFFATGADDCDGWSLFAEYCAGKLGWDASRVYVRSSSGRGHVVCVVRFNGACFQVGNWEPFQLSSDSLVGIGQEIAKRLDGNLSYAIRFKSGSYHEYVEI